MKKLILSISLASLMMACSKEPSKNLSVINDIESESISLNKYGMLQFKNMDHFTSTLSKLDKSPLEIANQITKNDQFISYAADTLDDNKSVGDFDPVFARVLNKNSAVQIGDSVRFFTKNFDYNINVNDVDLIKDAIQTQSFENKKIDRIKVTGAKFNIKGNGINKTAATSIKNYNGHYELITPESTSAKRPERSIFVIQNRKSSGYDRSFCFIYGQAYRKGGLFGSKKWREDEINTLVYDLISVRSTAGELVGPLYNLTVKGKAEHNIISTGGPSGFHNTFDYMDLRITNLRKNNENNDSNYGFSVVLSSQSPGTAIYNVTVNKNW